MSNDCDGHDHGIKGPPLVCPAPIEALTLVKCRLIRRPGLQLGS